MYIENLVSDVKPELQPWGETKVHVPLNIRKTTEVDADGVEKDKYIYDCVERVEKPVTVENIVKMASKAKFGEDIAEYVAANVFKSGDSKVKEYTVFAQQISQHATEAIVNLQ